MQTSITSVIEPRKGWQLLNWSEMRQYQDLLLFLVWRSIKIRYAQSAIGIGWAVIQPLFTVVIFTVVFGNLARMDSDGAPYALFSLAALVPWTYFANAVTEGTSSLITNANMISKIYFPRLFLPASAVLAKLVDFGIAFLLLVGMGAWFEVYPSMRFCVLPLLVICMTMAAAGIGFWLTALAIQYRDIKYGLNFLIQALMYSSPVVYSLNLVPEKWHILYAINPMVGVIEGFRYTMIADKALPWEVITVSTCGAFVLCITGAWYFRSKERVFADVA